MGGISPKRFRSDTPTSDAVVAFIVGQAHDAIRIFALENKR